MATKDQLDALPAKDRLFAELLLEISAKLKRLADLLDRELSQ